MIDKERAIRLLGAGVNGETVAATLGCEPSYISQLLSEDNFRERVVSLRVANLTKASERDAEIDDIEDVLIQKIKDSVDYITKPRDLISAFNVINKAVRRGTGIGQNTLQNNLTVQLTLPIAVQVRYTANSQGEVVDVNGQSVITMPPAQLLRNMAEQKGVLDELKAKELRALADRLPSEVLARSQRHQG